MPTQFKNFFKSIGFYARAAIFANVLIFAIQKLFLADEMTIALIFGFNYQSIVAANQYYRVLTAAFTH